MQVDSLPARPITVQEWTEEFPNHPDWESTHHFVLGCEHTHHTDFTQFSVRFDADGPVQLLHFDPFEQQWYHADSIEAACTHVDPVWDAFEDLREDPDRYGETVSIRVGRTDPDTADHVSKEDL